MNIQARNLANRKSRARSQAGRSILLRLWVLFNIIVICLAGFLIVNCKIAMAQEISATEKSIAQVKTELHQLDREMEVLRIRKESLCSWEYIRGRILAYNLPLRPAAPEQTRQLVLTRPATGDAFPPSATATADLGPGAYVYTLN